jgi:hypothetical protein
MAVRRKTPVEWSLRLEHPLFIGPKMPASERGRLRKRREMERKKPRPVWHPDFIGPRLTDRQRRTIRQKSYYRRNKDKCYASALVWTKKNPDKVRAQRRRYVAKHRDAHSAYSRAWKKKRYETDGVFRFRQKLRGRIIRALKEQYSEKAYSTIELLGATIEQTRAHLEARFKPGMTWENHGHHGWHVDHVIPCSCFDFSKPEHQRMCFHYTNLRPEWAKDNMARGDQITPDVVALFMAQSPTDLAWQDMVLYVDGKDVFEAPDLNDAPKAIAWAG